LRDVGGLLERVNGECAGGGLGGAVERGGGDFEQEEEEEEQLQEYINALLGDSHKTKMLNEEERRGKTQNTVLSFIMHQTSESNMACHMATNLFKRCKQSRFFCSSFCDFLLGLQFQLCTAKTKYEHS
jgi:hypothetical protein